MSATTSHTTVRITEDAGRIFITLAGPAAAHLDRSLRATFPGHHQIYWSDAHTRFRLWGRYRAALERWLDTTCDSAWVDWHGR